MEFFRGKCFLMLFLWNSSGLNPFLQEVFRERSVLNWGGGGVRILNGIAHYFLTMHEAGRGDTK